MVRGTERMASPGGHDTPEEKKRRDDLLAQIRHELDSKPVAGLGRRDIEEEEQRRDALLAEIRSKLERENAERLARQAAARAAQGAKEREREEKVAARAAAKAKRAAEASARRAQLEKYWEQRRAEYLRNREVRAARRDAGRMAKIPQHMRDAAQRAKEFQAEREAAARKAAGPEHRGQAQQAEASAWPGRKPLTPAQEVQLQEEIAGVKERMSAIAQGELAVSMTRRTKENAASAQGSPGDGEVANWANIQEGTNGWKADVGHQPQPASGMSGRENTAARDEVLVKRIEEDVAAQKLFSRWLKERLRAAREQVAALRAKITDHLRDIQQGRQDARERTGKNIARLQWEDIKKWLRKIFEWSRKIFAGPEPPAEIKKWLAEASDKQDAQARIRAYRKAIQILSVKRVWAEGVRMSRRMSGSEFDLTLDMYDKAKEYERWLPAKQAAFGALLLIGMIGTGIVAGRLAIVTDKFFGDLLRFAAAFGIGTYTSLIVSQQQQQRNFGPWKSSIEGIAAAVLIAFMAFGVSGVVQGFTSGK